MLSANPPTIALDDAGVRDELRRKLEWLLRIRRDAALGRAPSRAEAQELAAAFPGALRELDDTPLAALEERLASLDGEALPPWAKPTWLYHRALRDLLAATRSGQRPRGALVDLALAHAASALGMTVADVEAHALPHARRRATNGSAPRRAHRP